MQRYVAFLRGINVGGHTLIKMDALKVALTEAGLSDVRTYIQSGNVLFSAAERDARKLATTIKQIIENEFSFAVDVAVFTDEQWRAIVKAAPKWWGVDNAWKHNILIVIEPCTMEEAMAAFDGLKSDIESVESGKGVIYQSVCFAKFSRTKSGRLAAHPVYKKLTIRNYNTATKLLKLLD